MSSPTSTWAAAAFASVAMRHLDGRYVRGRGARATRLPRAGWRCGAVGPAPQSAPCAELHGLAEVGEHMRPRFESPAGRRLHVDVLVAALPFDRRRVPAHANRQQVALPGGAARGGRDDVVHDDVADAVAD